MKEQEEARCQPHEHLMADLSRDLWGSSQDPWTQTGLLLIPELILWLEATTDSLVLPFLSVE